MSHTNNGICNYCLKIAHRYGNPNIELITWFQDFQKEHPEAHISCFGRGKQDQEEMCMKGVSHAHWGQSAHNYNAAIDVFETATMGNIYSREWFRDVLAPNLPDWIEWYGRHDAVFFELPHLQLRDWKEMITKGELTLVE